MLCLSLSSPDLTECTSILASLDPKTSMVELRLDLIASPTNSLADMQTALRCAPLQSIITCRHLVHFGETEPLAWSAQRLATVKAGIEWGKKCRH